jgi:SAM-dependent methyltransferase
MVSTARAAQVGTELLILYHFNQDNFMAHETSKSKELRTERNHFLKYFVGEGLDIGAGDDPLETPYGNVATYDMTQGNANYLSIIDDGTYDFVYSSHCLEHMPDVPLAIRHWARVLKPGGILYITVPDWMLYEHKHWPSIFNLDHRATFSVSVPRSEVDGRKNHYHVWEDLLPIFRANRMQILDTALEDIGYDYDAPDGLDQSDSSNALCQIRIIATKALEVVGL